MPQKKFPTDGQAPEVNDFLHREIRLLVSYLISISNILQFGTGT